MKMIKATLIILAGLVMASAAQADQWDSWGDGGRSNDYGISDNDNHYGDDNYGDDFGRSVNRNRQRLVLDFYDQHLRGNNTLKLKNKIRNMYPNIRLRNAEIVRVRLVAKTKHGRGTAALRVGSNMTQRRMVYGHPSDFHRSNANSFDRVDFQSPSYNSDGAWQVQLNGNFKVRKVVVVLRTNQRPPTPPRRPNPPRYPNEQFQYLNCQSWGGYNTCYVGSRILDASLNHQYSTSSCIYGYSWGYTRDSIWVDNNCRGEFRIKTRR